MEEEPLAKMDHSSWHFDDSEVDDYEALRRFVLSIGCTARFMIPWVSLVLVGGGGVVGDQSIIQGMPGQEDVPKKFTHLIVGTNNNMETTVTIRVLQALAKRTMMMVSEKWVSACLEDKANLSKIANWEAKIEGFGDIVPSRKAREARERGDPPLLHKIQIVVDDKETFTRWDDKETFDWDEKDAYLHWEIGRLVVYSASQVAIF